MCIEQQIRILELFLEGSRDSRRISITFQIAQIKIVNWKYA